MTWWSWSKPDNDWAPYKEWEDRQGVGHYRNTYAYQHYLCHQAWYRTAVARLLRDERATIAYQYCFGYFAPLVMLWLTNTTPKQAITQLLSTYEACRGYYSMVTGNHPGIEALYQYVRTGQLDCLAELRSEKYSYPYTYLHGHTMAARSMSLLIIRLAQHYLAQRLNEPYPKITMSACQRAVEDVIWTGQSLGTSFFNPRSAARCIACNQPLPNDRGSAMVECSRCNQNIIPHASSWDPVMAYSDSD